MRAFPPTVEIKMVKINASVMEEKQAAVYLGRPLSFLRDARTGRAASLGPQVIRVGRSVIYTKEFCDLWLSEQAEEQSA